MAVSLALLERLPRLPFWRRRQSPTRIKTPPGLKLAGLAYLLLPAANLVYGFIAVGGSWRQLLGSYSILALLLFLSAPFVAAGLLRVRRWGYFAFLTHAGILIGYSLALFLAEPSVARSGEIFRSAIALLLLGYFLQRDISAPYLNPGWRGFRQRPRQTIQTGIQIGDQRATTRDLSVLGCYVSLPNNSMDQTKIGQALRIKLQLHHGLTLELNAEAVRTDPDGLGLRFTTTRASRRAIRDFLRLVYPERFAVFLESTVQFGAATQSARLLDISTEGAYMAIATPPPAQTQIDLTIEHNERFTTIPAQIAWSNPEGQFQRPPGVGIRFVAPNAAARRAIRLMIKQGEKSR